MLLGSLKVGKNPSLNDCLHSGPSFIPKIFDILQHFRWLQVPLTPDISKVFLQISIKPERQGIPSISVGE